MNIRISIPWKTAFFTCFAAFTIGYFLAQDYQAYLMQFLKKYLSGVQFSLFGIFLNNLAAASLIFIGGYLFGAITIAITVLNFALLGCAAHIFPAQIGLLKFMASVIPHGIFEIPAIFLSFSFGLTLARTMILNSIRQEKESLGDLSRILLFRFATQIIPLLLVAAVIETYITPMIIKRF